MRFALKLPVGRLQARAVTLLSHTDPQHTARRPPSSERQLRPPASQVIFSSATKSCGIVDRLLDRRPHQIRAPEAQPGSVPEHGIAPKDIRQRVKRHAPLPQEERFLHLFGAPDPIGQEKGRPDGEDFSRGLELNPPHDARLFAHAIAVVPTISPAPTPAETVPGVGASRPSARCRYLAISSIHS